MMKLFSFRASSYAFSLHLITGGGLGQLDDEMQEYNAAAV